jgi:hypothetical protein
MTPKNKSQYLDKYQSLQQNNSQWSDTGHRTPPATGHNTAQHNRIIGKQHANNHRHRQCPGGEGGG